MYDSDLLKCFQKEQYIKRSIFKKYFLESEMRRFIPLVYIKKKDRASNQLA